MMALLRALDYRVGLVAPPNSEERIQQRIADRQRTHADIRRDHEIQQLREKRGNHG